MIILGQRLLTNDSSFYLVLIVSEAIGILTAGAEMRERM